MKVDHLKVKEFLRSKSLKYREHSTREEQFFISCPRCGDRKTHLGINLLKGVYGCFRCGWSGTLSYLLRYFGYNDNKVFSVPISEREIEGKERRAFSPVPLISRPKDSVSLLLDYLKKRDFLDKKYLFYCDVSLPSYLGIPFYTLIPPVKLSFIQFRDVSSKEKRIVTYKILSKGGFFYWSAESEDMFLVEGPFDAKRKGFYSIGGSILSLPQLEELKDYLSIFPKRVVLFLDWDAVFQTEKIYNILRENLSVEIGVVDWRELFPKTDPGDLETLEGLPILWRREEIIKYFCFWKISRLREEVCPGF